MYRNRFATWLVIALLVATAGCDDGEVTTPVPVPGDLAISLVSPNGAEGAAVFETSDPGIVGIAAAGSVDAFHLEGAGGKSRIVVLLDQPGTIAFTLSVEDLNDPPQMEIVEVADPDNRLRAVLTGYELRSTPIEPANGAASR
jgi:hypothetical protein